MNVLKESAKLYSVARACAYVPYPSLIRALHACASVRLRALPIVNTQLTCLYPHQLRVFTL